MKRISTAVFLAAAFATADQAQSVTPAQAQGAQELLRFSGRLVNRCEPCGEYACDEEAIQKMEIKEDGDDAELYVNGNSKDLAYIYFLKNGNWTNVAMELGISVKDVTWVLGPDDCKTQPKKPRHTR